MTSLSRVLSIAAAIGAVGIAATAWSASVKEESMMAVNKAEQTEQERNVEIVLAMWEGVIRNGDKEAALRYVHPDYIQHNVNMPSGRDALLRLAEIVKDPPEGFPVPGYKTVLYTMAQDDRVIVIWDQPQRDPENPDQTYVGQAFDMFRLEDGLIVEHWDDTRKTKPWM